MFFLFIISLPAGYAASLEDVSQDASLIQSISGSRSRDFTQGDSAFTIKKQYPGAFYSIRIVNDSPMAVELKIKGVSRGPNFSDCGSRSYMQHVFDPGTDYELKNVYACDLEDTQPKEIGVLVQQVTGWVYFAPESEKKIVFKMHDGYGVWIKFANILNKDRSHLYGIRVLDPAYPIKLKHPEAIYHIRIVNDSSFVVEFKMEGVSRGYSLTDCYNNHYMQGNTYPGEDNELKNSYVCDLENTQPKAIGILVKPVTQWLYFTSNSEQKMLLKRNDIYTVSITFEDAIDEQGCHLWVIRVL